MLKGSCLCGKVRWSYGGSFDQVTHCHCQMCRKSHGAPFATYAVGPASEFSYDQATDGISQFESSKGFIRSFCAGCGSVVPNTHLGNVVAIPIGGAEGPVGIKPSAHIFTRWKAPWHSISDSLPQHDNYPNQPKPAVDRSQLAPSTDGLIRGSCLCGDVRFEITGGFQVVHNCHCSRCRKARAAVHTTNGFVKLDQIQIVHGLASINTYQPPDARFFAQSFCSKCGSKVPRLNKPIDRAVVPFGSLDDDPGCGAQDHIYVGSKASWYAISDELPQFQQGPS